MTTYLIECKKSSEIISTVVKYAEPSRELLKILYPELINDIENAINKMRKKHRI